MKVLTFATVLAKKPNDIVIDFKIERIVTTQAYDCNVIENHAGYGSRGGSKESPQCCLAPPAGLEYIIRKVPFYLIFKYEM